VSEIKQMNQLFGNHLFPGQKIKVITKKETRENKDIEYGQHIVAPFETLAMIALAYDMKVGSLPPTSPFHLQNTEYHH
jgi:hypothetical protein